MQEVDTTHRRAGRPNIQGTGNERNIPFRIKLTQAERDRLDELAEDAGCTPSQYVRDRIFGNK
jgi:hypothetical protein